jgi:hypothetical protein
MFKGKPEQQAAPAELYYNDEEADKYHSKCAKSVLTCVISPLRAVRVCATSSAR